jgi:hypothetical protein
VAIPNHARALPQDDPRRRPAFNGGFIGRDGDLEIVVSWRLIKDSERGGSRGRNRRARCPPRAKRRVDAVNQIIVAKWFWQVANNSETKGLGSNIFIRLSGNQNGGKCASMIASVQPSGDAASNSSARRRSMRSAVMSTP